MKSHSIATYPEQDLVRLSFSVILFWSPISFHTLDKFTYPSRFPLMRILLQRWIYWSLWFLELSIFLLSFFIHDCIMNYRYFCFCFFRIFSKSLSRFVVSCAFIKYHIPADVNLLVSWEIDSVSLRAFRVSHKYNLEVTSEDEFLFPVYHNGELQ